MLKRVYIDNFRSFVNFELSLGQQQLILGLNGSGKSTLLEVLTAVKKLITGAANPDLLFPESSRTRWQALSQQTFELEVDLGAIYQFRLELDSWGTPPRIRVHREIVTCDQRPIFEFVAGEVHLFNDRFEQRVTYPFDWFRSALATVQPRSENKKLMQFKNWIENLHCLQLNPHLMSERTESEDPEPTCDMSNFASWYRYMTQERADFASSLQDHLRQLMPGFESLDLRSAGANLRVLAVRFTDHTESSPRNSFAVTFRELSDGQRVLICLYALLNFIVKSNACLFLDEPENYIAIPEIQPWLMELRDRIEDLGGQVILISHHPEIVNYLAPELGLVFERVGPGPVRVRSYKPDHSLLPSEQIARGWSTDG
jgi:energy-coupling factor transporter ATP-binding protein EcfA2